MKSILEIFSLKNITLFLLVLFCIRYIPLETRAGPSLVKFAVSGLVALLFIIRIPKISKAVKWFGLYFIIVFTFAYGINPLTFRWSTILYLLSFLVVFVFYYNQIYCEHTINHNTFLDFLRKFIIVYTVVLVIQQLALIVGIRELSFINLTQFLDRGIGANSLSGEPSTTARILGVLFLSYIRMLELKYDSKLTIKEIYKEDRWVILCFVWAMISMGSGTAFVVLFILTTYFIQRKYLMIVFPVIIASIIIIPYIDFEPLQRAYNIIGAFISGDQEEVISTDQSAASRVTGLMNMFTNVNYFNIKTWVGHGCDYSASFGGYNDRLRTNLIGMIAEYGMLSFIIMQICIFKCCLKKIFSLETVMWIFLFSATFANTAYVWGCLMVFSTVRYFQEQKEQELL